MATRAQERQRQRQRARAQRQRERNRRRQQRRKERTRRIAIRQDVRKEKITQKGESGFYSPEGIGARGDVGLGILDRAIDVGKLVSTGGTSAFVPDSFGSVGERRDAIQDVMVDSSFNGSGGFGGSGGSGGSDNGAVETYKEEKPIWQNPYVIGGAVLGGIVLFNMRRKK